MKKSVFLIFLAAIGVIGYHFYNKPQQSTALILYGNVDIRQVNSAFRVAGRLQEMNFEEGDIVHKGDVLAVLDTEPLINAQNQAKAKVMQAAAAADNAARINKRKQTLCKSNTVSQQDCDNAQAQADIAEADLAYAEASLDVADTALNDAALTAPSDGVILTRIVEPGTLLSAGVPVYTISLNDKMWVRAYIKETELGKIQIGTKMQIYTDSTDKVYHGHVGFISSTAEFTPKNIETASLRTDLVYRLRIVIDDADDFLKQGMPVTVKLDE
ncbi:MAG: efflux RND transporter periplasmic adaptor subunit [Alphaproteobacteria bacterium]|nr:efflux RND transporter periplasmic adaptor subunit [Alphaproteobacteria bacterium]MBP5353465.1 efflux RND transporter periplasmic adaptor subunit [Alphaproteobacteria bacterium]